MQRLGTVEPVRELTNWLNPLLIFEKRNKKMWICLDPKHLNQAIRRQYYKFPTVSELSSGYWQIKVDGESLKILTFSTPFDRLRFKRLPYGIHSASEVFQQDIKEIIEGCEGARNTQEYIILWRLTINQLDIRTD